MLALAPEEDDTAIDFTSLISEKLGTPFTSRSFGKVYRCTIETSNGKVETAVKVFVSHPSKAVEQFEKRIRRELKVWLRLKHPTIVQLLGIAYVDPPLPALVSQWMSSGTLYIYLKEATVITFSVKVGLAKGVADGLNYLHSENVIHGDLHPIRMVVSLWMWDSFVAPGKFEGEAELQLNTTTAERSFNSRWRAPEVIGIERGPERPNFKTLPYPNLSRLRSSRGDMPWKEKNSVQICIALSNKTIHARPENILDDQWNLIQQCWSWEPGNRPSAAEILLSIDQSKIDHSQASIFMTDPRLAADLTGQIFGTFNDYVAGGAFGNVYRCEWRGPSGTIEVAVKALKFHPSEQNLRRIRREAAIWEQLVHDNIVTLYGTTKGFGPTTALVSPWFPHGTLLRLITEQGASAYVIQSTSCKGCRRGSRPE
ncbi:kinase-like domain-containing protein [Suillus placidus]|uniref:Kinase-like domain-containing protein n=1 Tax=Suillus placidus TaxID=48579 RepID=A0A9P7CWR5_9AGAM|nr:kinase-like domain-containing protein [Suillus placidus]